MLLKFNLVTHQKMSPKKCWLPISGELFWKLLIGLYFQCFLYNEKNY